ncbi:MAG TPA: glycosyltransferase family 4 protein [archaeon]|nr:glycosyltransferase family 4 protein [archaeon]
MNITEITTYKVGGIYTHVTELVKRIEANSIIITGNTKESGCQKEDGFNYFHIPALVSIWDIFFINLPFRYKKIEEIHKKNDIDLIHLHGPMFTFCNEVIHKTRLPTIMTTHYVLDFRGNRILEFFYKLVIKWVTLSTSRSVDKMVCINEDYIHIYVGWGVDPDKLVYIPNGIDSEKFSPGISGIKQVLGCEHLLIFWGRLSYQKNIKVLIEAFKQIETPHTKLAIVGEGPDIRKLKHLVGTNENVIFTGYLSDDELLEYARGSDIAVLPSRAESWGLVVGEAMACELPVITSDVGKARELLGDGRGIILEAETSAEIARHIDHLLNNKEVAEDMGRRSRKFVVENYGWDEVARQTEELYRTLIGKADPDINGKYMGLKRI